MEVSAESLLALAKMLGLWALTLRRSPGPASHCGARGVELLALLSAGGSHGGPLSLWGWCHCWG